MPLNALVPRLRVHACVQCTYSVYILEFRHWKTARLNNSTAAYNSSIIIVSCKYTQRYIICNVYFAILYPHLFRSTSCASIGCNTLECAYAYHICMLSIRSLPIYVRWRGVRVFACRLRIMYWQCWKKETVTKTNRRNNRLTSPAYSEKRKKIHDDYAFFSCMSISGFFFLYIPLLSSSSLLCVCCVHLPHSYIRSIVVEFTFVNFRFLSVCFVFIHTCTLFLYRARSHTRNFHFGICWLHAAKHMNENERKEETKHFTVCTAS